MLPDLILQFLLAGLTTGAVYALIALGFIAIYRASNILNLAQGEFVMLGGLTTVFLMTRCGFGYLPAALTAVAAVTLAGLVVQRAIIHPVRDEPVLIRIMITIGISFFLSGSAGLLFGTNPASLPPFIAAAPVRLPGGIRVDVQSIVILGATLLLLLLLFGFSRLTFMGRAMEAVSTDRYGADITGIPSDFIVLAAFGISAAVGAVAGICITPVFFTQYNAGGILALKGFAAAVIGGWGRYSGAVLGGLLLGVIEAVGIGFMPSGYRDALAFGTLMLILYLRPKGLLGSRALTEARK